MGQSWPTFAVVLSSHSAFQREWNLHVETKSQVSLEVTPQKPQTRPLTESEILACRWSSASAVLYNEGRELYNPSFFRGGIAQLGERLHGMQEVRGSIPRTSTSKSKETCSGPHRLEA
ncbi:hypothetical protein ACCAA_10082 [Candidatus Accumulibacter aalborgensis]|uniref:Uncharacterized protein n=1 Tax=Candidatus Accumulibacter aalborgensis TaxID=1860102 RepID=A0A1A8XFK2_9PROT|nr:hypothetical protein ACCAA_10082 [Candidatus Accumulibacter aalborgensis]